MIFFFLSVAIGCYCHDLLNFTQSNIILLWRKKFWSLFENNACILKQIVQETQKKNIEI